MRLAGQLDRRMERQRGPLVAARLAAIDAAWAEAGGAGRQARGAAASAAGLSVFVNRKLDHLIGETLTTRLKRRLG